MLRIDTVIALLSAVVTLCGYLPLAPYLGVFPRLLLPAALAGGILARRRGRRLPDRFLTACGVLAFLVYAAQVRGANLVSPAADLLTVLLALRLVGEQSSRHRLQGYVLALFCLSASSLFNLDSLFLVYLLVMLLALAVSLVLLSFVAVDPDAALPGPALGKVLRTAALLPVAAVPLALLFFIILPRSQFALLDFLNQQGAAVVGFSERVQPGSASSQSAVKTLAFRAETGQLADDQLYWRGIVLDRFTGTAWERTSPPGYEVPVRSRGGAVSLTLYPEPAKSRYLITLDLPQQVTGVRSTRAGDAVYLRSQTGTGRVRYTVTALTNARLRTVSGARRPVYLQLPPTISPALVRLAREVTAGARNGDEVLARYERFYRDGRFRYATTGLPTDARPLETFLLTKRAGNCEFFASSLALLLRLSGVPARLVGGYQGGDFNGLGGYYAVTEDRAHVWVEAAPDGRGWLRVDPSRWAVNAGERNTTAPAGLFVRLRQAADAADYFWTRSVIVYDLEQQVEMVRRAGRWWGGSRLSLTGWRPLAGGAALLAAGWAAVLLLRQRRPGREERLLRQLYRRLRRRGMLPERYAAMGLYRLAEEVGDPALRRFAARYGEIVYRDRRLSAGEFTELRRLLCKVGTERGAPPVTAAGDDPDGA